MAGSPPDDVRAVGVLPPEGQAGVSGVVGNRPSLRREGLSRGGVGLVCFDPRVVPWVCVGGRAGGHDRIAREDVGPLGEWPVGGNGGGRALLATVADGPGGHAQLSRVAPLRSVIRDGTRLAASEGVGQFSTSASGSNPNARRYAGWRRKGPGGCAVPPAGSCPAPTRPQIAGGGIEVSEDAARSDRAIARPDRSRLAHGAFQIGWRHRRAADASDAFWADLRAPAGHPDRSPDWQMRVAGYRTLDVRGLRRTPVDIAGRPMATIWPLGWVAWLRVPGFRDGAIVFGRERRRPSGRTTPHIGMVVPGASRPSRP